MKTIIVLLTAILISGCYTVIWTPDEEFPNERNTEYGNDSYYPDYYYGGYNDFYDYPWWLNFTPPSYIAPKSTPDRSDNGNTGTIRNNDNGRGKEDRNKILETPPPTKTETKGSSDTSSSSSGNNRTSVESSNNNAGSNTSSRGSTNTNSNNVRNNDGGRSSGGRR